VAAYCYCTYLPTYLHHIPPPSKKPYTIPYPKMYTPLLVTLGLTALATAQSQANGGPPPPPETLSTTKSGVLPIIPTGTPFAGVDTLEGAIISPLPPSPGYAGVLGPAPSQTNQPAAIYRATMPSVNFDPLVGPAVQGTVEAVGQPGGVRFSMNLRDLPLQSAYGPFAWHIHTLGVPADGNCTATMGHLDPQNVGELYMCDPATPAACQVGDLAGKHGGKITTEGQFATSFVDAYLSTNESSPAFFGGLAFVLHTGNTSRITCANFELVGGQANGTAGGNETASPTGSAGLPESTGAAATVMAGFGAVAVGLLAALL
jgi:Cu/Zn superoxide dismutase